MRDRKLSSPNPDVMFPALVRAGLATPIYPTTDTGYKSYGTGRLFLPAGTNYLSNPSFETDSDSDGLSDSWTVSEDSGNTPTYSRTSGRTGGYSQRVQLGAHAGDSASYFTGFGYSAAGTFAQGDSATASFYIRGTQSGCAVQLLCRSRTAAAATVDTATTAITLATAWQRVSATITSCGVDTSYIQCYVNITGIGAGDSFDIEIDDMIIEKSAVLTPYFDGTYPDCVWTGTANASTSTRTTSLLQYSTSTIGAGWTTCPASGTIAVFVTEPAAFFATNIAPLVGFYNNSTPVAYLTHSTGKYRLWSNNACTSAVEPGIGYNRAVGRWDAAGTYVNANGTEASAGAVPTTGGATNLITIGYAGTGTNTLIGNSMKSIIISPTKKTDGWVTAIQASSGAAYTSPMHLWRDFMEPGDIIFPLLKNSVGYRKTNGAGSTMPAGLEYGYTTTAASTDTGYEVYDG